MTTTLMAVTVLAALLIAYYSHRWSLQLLAALDGRYPSKQHSVHVYLPASVTSSDPLPSAGVEKDVTSGMVEFANGCLADSRVIEVEPLSDAAIYGLAI